MKSQPVICKKNNFKQRPQILKDLLIFLATVAIVLRIFNIIPDTIMYL